MNKLIFSCLLFLGIFVGVNAANAGTTYTWTGGSATTPLAWIDPTNWSVGSGYPGSTGSTDVAIFNFSAGSLTAPVNIAAAGITIGQLQINAGAVYITVSVPTSVGLGSIYQFTSKATTVGKTSPTTAATLGILGQGTSNYVNFVCSTSLSVVASSEIDLIHAAIVSGGSSTFNSGTTLTLSTVSSTYSSGNSAYQTNGGTSQFTSATVNFGTGSFIDNGSQGVNATINCNSTIFNLTSTASTYTDQYIRNETGAQISSTGCTFNLSGLNSFIDNDNLFTDHGSTFNLSQVVDGTSSYTGTGHLIPAPSSDRVGFESFGTFTTVGTTFELYGQYTGTKNLATDDEFFVNDDGDFLLDPTSKILFNPSSSNIVVSNGSLSPSGSNFLFLSDITGSAFIGNLNSSTNSFVGNYYVQRYIAQYAAGYRLLSAPVVGNTSLTPAGVVDLTYLSGIGGMYTSPVGTTTYGPATGGPSSTFTINDAAHGGNPTIYLYDEAIVPPPTATGNNQNFFNEKSVGLTSIGSTSDNFSNTNTTPTTGSLSFLPGTGFNLYYSGGTNNYNTTHLATAPASTITWYGQLNTGSIGYVNWANHSGVTPNGTALTYTAAAPYPGFNLVGNPYQCTIDLALVASQNGSAMSFYELDDNQLFDSYLVAGNNQYSSTAATLTSNGTTSAATEFVAPGMGFYAAVTAAQSLNFNESQKVTTQYNPSSTPTFLSVLPTSTRAEINSSSTGVASIHLALQKDSLTAKSCGIYFNEASSDKFDKYDAIDFDGILPAVYMSSYTSDNVRTTINGLGSYTKGKYIKLFVKAAASGTYTLNVTDLTNVDLTAFRVLLIDSYKKDTVDFATTKSYSFAIDTSNASSFGDSRMSLSIQRKPLPAYKLLSFASARDQSSVTLSWKANNEGDYTTFALQKLNATSNQYSTVYNVQSNGSGNYSYVDKSPSTGVNTYRLSQNDIDSVTTYSRSLSVNFSTVNLGPLSVYPNPTKDVVTVSFNNVTAITSDVYNVNIYNSMGVLIMQQSISANSLSQDVSSLKPGAYIIEVKTNYGNSIGNAKFVKN